MKRVRIKVEIQTEEYVTSKYRLNRKVHDGCACIITHLILAHFPVVGDRKS